MIDHHEKHSIIRHKVILLLLFRNGCFIIVSVYQADLIALIATCYGMDFFTVFVWSYVNKGFFCDVCKSLYFCITCTLSYLEVKPHALLVTKSPNLLSDIKPTFVYIICLILYLGNAFQSWICFCKIWASLGCQEGNRIFTRNETYEQNNQS